MRLLTKFSLMFVAVFGLGLGAAAWLFKGQLQRNAREQVLHDAQLMMETALAMRAYTITQVRPALADSDQGKAKAAEREDEVFRELCAKRGYAVKRVFRPQTVPAYSATEMFNELRKKYPDYLYKEAAQNPTNPRNRALDWEEDLIKHFRNHPDTTVFEGERSTPLGRSLYLARPMRAGGACLECHSTPVRAPAEMIQLYGPGNGFGWQEGDVVAAQIVSVPVAVATSMADRAFRRLVLALLLVGVVTLAVMDLALYAAVIRPVGAFARRADEISRGRIDVPELPVRGRDEIAVLAGAFNRMHRSVRTAARLLEGEADAPPPTSTPGPGPGTPPPTEPRG
jgi:protein-histidine pros-kinase